MVLRTLFAMPAMKYLLSPLRGRDREPCIFFAEMISTLELRSHHGAARSQSWFALLLATSNELHLTNGTEPSQTCSDSIDEFSAAKSKSRLNRVTAVS